jgi:HAD superfamily hydrolase (TIGR01490 family)
VTAAEAPATRVAAFFDLDGTLAASNPIRTFLYFVLSEEPWWLRPALLAATIVPISACAALDRFDRRRFNLLFYRLYARMPPERVERLAGRCAEITVHRRLYPEVVEVLHGHRAAGEDVVLVTGALDLVVAHVAQRLGAVVGAATTLERAGARFSGRLCHEPIVGNAKRLAIERFAAERGYDLSRCHAYGDHVTDLPFLSSVGRPVVVRPDRRLLAEARRRGFRVLGDLMRE